jgi:hypothetical protein
MQGLFLSMRSTGALVSGHGSEKFITPLFLGTTLTEEKIKGERLDNLEKKLRILKEHFGEGNVFPELFEAFMKAGTPDEMESALQHMFQEKILDVRISKFPFITTVEEAKKEMISLKEILEQANKP